VQIVLDELPQTTLADSRGRIDAEHDPGLALPEIERAVEDTG